MRRDVFFHDAEHHDALRRHLDRRLDELERKIGIMSNSIQDLDQAITDFEAAAEAADAADAAAEQEILTAVNDIAARVGPTVDVSAEIGRIQQAMQKRAAASAQLGSAKDTIKGLDVQPSPGGKKS